MFSNSICTTLKIGDLFYEVEATGYRDHPYAVNRIVATIHGEHHWERMGTFLTLDEAISYAEALLDKDVLLIRDVKVSYMDVIPRDITRTEHDDLVFNVLPRLGKYYRAVPIVVGGLLVAWRILFKD